jgi:AmmeMemoRadiSam system protein B
MAKDKSIYFYEPAHRDEHSLEIQLPFLQKVIPDFKMVPIVMGDQSLKNCKKLASVIEEFIDERTLLVASTDLSHYHSQVEAEELDNIIIEAIRDFAPERLADDLGQRKCEACGGGPVVTTMLALKAKGAKKARVLKYATSGDITGDREQVVGYLSAAIYR